MKKNASLVVLAVLMLLFVPKAFGQVGLYAGLLAGYSSQTPSIPDTDTIFTTDTTFCYGLRIGLRVLMIEIEGSYFQASHNINFEEGPIPDWSGKDIDYNYVGVSLKYVFTLPVIHPYLTVGYGYYSADIAAIDQASDGGYNFGAGVEVMLGKKFGLVLEGKYHHVSLDVQNLDLGLGDFTLTGGVNIYIF